MKAKKRLLHIFSGSTNKYCRTMVRVQSSPFRWIVVWPSRYCWCNTIKEEEVDPSSSVWFVTHTLCAGGKCHCSLFHFHRLLWWLGGCPVWTGRYNRYFIASGWRRDVKASAINKPKNGLINWAARKVKFIAVTAVADDDGNKSHTNKCASSSCLALLSNQGGTIFKSIPH